MYWLSYLFAFIFALESSPIREGASQVHAYAIVSLRNIGIGYWILAWPHTELHRLHLLSLFLLIRRLVPEQIYHWTCICPPLRLHIMSTTPFDAALVRVLEVLEFSEVPTVTNSLSEAHILSYASFIGAKERINKMQIPGLPPWAPSQLLSAIAWHDNFRESNGHDPDVLTDLTVSSFKAFQAERAEDETLRQLIPQYRSLSNSHSPGNITRAAGIHSQIMSTKNGMSKMIQMDTDTIMQRLPHRIKSLGGIIDTEKFVKLIVQCIRAQSDMAVAETLKKIVIMGRTQGKI